VLAAVDGDAGHAVLAYATGDSEAYRVDRDEVSDRQRAAVADWHLDDLASYLVAAGPALRLRARTVQMQIRAANADGACSDPGCPFRTGLIQVHKSQVAHTILNNCTHVMLLCLLSGTGNCSTPNIL
jgi:hypothetical protein